MLLKIHSMDKHKRNKVIWEDTDILFIIFMPCVNKKKKSHKETQHILSNFYLSIYDLNCTYYKIVLMFFLEFCQPDCKTKELGIRKLKKYWDNFKNIHVFPTQMAGVLHMTLIKLPDREAQIYKTL